MSWPTVTGLRGRFSGYTVCFVNLVARRKRAYDLAIHVNRTSQRFELILVPFRPNAAQVSEEWPNRRYRRGLRLG